MKNLLKRLCKVKVGYYIDSKAINTDFKNNDICAYSHYGPKYILQWL